MATINQPFLPERRTPLDGSSNVLNVLFSRVYALNWEVILWTVLLLAALFTRFFELGQRVMSHDESLHTLYSHNLYRDGNFQHTPLMHGPILFHMTAFFYFLFGPSDFSARIYAAVFSVIIVMFPLLLRRWLGRWGAILAGVMLLASPLMMFYGRYIREDTPAILATLLMFYAIVMYLAGPDNQRQRAHWLYVLAAALLWNLGTKETAFIYVAVFGLFGTLYWLARMGQVYLGWRGRPIFYTGMMGMLLGVIATLGMIVVISVSLGSRATNETIGAILGLQRQSNSEFLITLSERLRFLGNQFNAMISGGTVTSDFVAFLSWTGLVVASILAVSIGTALWAYRTDRARWSVTDILAIPVGLVILLMVGGATTLGIGLILTLSFGLVYGAVRLHNGSIRAGVSYIGAVLVALIVYWLFDRQGILPPAADGASGMFDRAALLVIALFGIMAGGLGVTWMNPSVRGRPAFGRVLGAILVVAVLTSAVLLIVEELSFEPSRSEDSAAAQPVPGEESAVVEEDGFTLTPIFLAYLLGGAGIALVLFLRRRGIFDEWAEYFPEFDILILMGTLVLPWLTAIFIVATHGAAQDYIDIANRLPVIVRENLPVGDVQPGQELEMVGRVIVGFNAWLPLMTLAIVAGLAWNWRKWLIASAIFHILFAFFFTTIFTNIAGLATGMIYSLQYWLEQQGVRRGSQPQYYYLVLIMPFYEFLPVIGSVLAMVGGMVVFWRRQRDQQDAQCLAFEDLSAMGEGLPPVDALQQVDDANDAGVREMPDDGYSEDGELPADKPKRKRSERVPEHDRLHTLPFLLFVAFWGVMNLFAYTLAGEKMPWLGTHLTVPLILLTAWYFGRIFDRIDLRRLMDRGWIYLFLLPLLFVTGFQVIAPYLGGQPPFSGQQRNELAWTYQWLAVVGISVILIVIILRMVERTGWPHLRHVIAVASFSVLALLTIRMAWTASFINYDLGTEFLVYAHGGPGNRLVVDQLEEISLKTTGSLDINFAYDDGMHWPGLWYFRDFKNRVGFGNNPTLQQIDAASVVVVAQEGLMQVQPLLQDRFQQFTYVRMYWPMQDYFDLNAQRINDLFDLSSENTASGAIRRGVFDIWWARDYATYGAATGKTFDLTRWPLMDELHFFVRRDIAAQVWPLGTGEGSPLVQVAPEVQSACVTQWQQLSANLIFDTTVSPLTRPISLTLSRDGQRVFVAEEGANRISVFTVDGEYINSYGERGTADQDGLYFERPHDVAAAVDGSLFVADFWNHRIRHFDGSFNSLNAWGSPVFAGAGAPREPLDGFYGPRDVLVDDAGTVYVADTGNKRVRVYSQEGVWLRDIGAGGSGPGQLDEPVGLALHPDGRLFVADTWNRRISVFDAATGASLTSFTVDLWQSKPNNLPYLALDSERDLLYVSDPDAGRVLVYNTAGECQGAFGQFNFEAPNNTQFAAIGGLALDAEGQLYIVDVATGRILRFDPYPLTSDVASQDDPGGAGDAINAVLEQAEATQEAPVGAVDNPEAADPEMTEEATPEPAG